MIFVFLLFLYDLIQFFSFYGHLCVCLRCSLKINFSSSTIIFFFARSCSVDRSISHSFSYTDFHPMCVHSNEWEEECEAQTTNLHSLEDVLLMISVLKIVWSWWYSWFVTPIQSRFLFRKKWYDYCFIFANSEFC